MKSIIIILIFIQSVQAKNDKQSKEVKNTLPPQSKAQSKEVKNTLPPQSKAQSKGKNTLPPQSKGQIDEGKITNSKAQKEWVQEETIYSKDQNINSIMSLKYSDSQKEGFYQDKRVVVIKDDTDQCRSVAINCLIRCLANKQCRMFIPLYSNNERDLNLSFISQKQQCVYVSAPEEC